MVPGTESVMRAMRFLLQEGSPLNGNIISALLVRRGHTVCLAADGRTAVTELVRHSFDCLLIDFVQERADALATVDAVRGSVTEEVDASIPIIVLVGECSSDERARFVEVGVDAVLVKPVQGGMLLKTLHDVMVRKGVPVLLPGQTPAQRMRGTLRSKKEIAREFGLLSEDVDELYRALLVSVSSEFSALRVAVQEGWLDEVADVAHHIAGSPLDIVSIGPTLLAREIEHAARSGYDRELAALCDELEQQLHVVMGRINRALPDSGTVL